MPPTRSASGTSAPHSAHGTAPRTADTTQRHRRPGTVGRSDRRSCRRGACTTSAPGHSISGRRTSRTRVSVGSSAQAASASSRHRPRRLGVRGQVETSGCAPCSGHAADPELGVVAAGVHCATAVGVVEHRAPTTEFECFVGSRVRGGCVSHGRSPRLGSRRRAGSAPPWLGRGKRSGSPPGRGDDLAVAGHGTPPVVAGRVGEQLDVSDGEVGRLAHRRQRQLVAEDLDDVVVMPSTGPTPGCRTGRWCRVVVMWCSWLVGVMAPESTASRSASVRANGSGISAGAGSAAGTPGSCVVSSVSGGRLWGFLWLKWARPRPRPTPT